MTKVDAKIKIKIHIANNSRRKKKRSKKKKLLASSLAIFIGPIMLNVLLSDSLEVMNIFSAIHVK